MTPKEKAQELIKKMGDEAERFYTWEVKACALIAVSPLDPNNAEEWLQPEDWFSDANISAEKYWLEVKQETNNL